MVFGPNFTVRLVLKGGVLGFCVFGFWAPVILPLSPKRTHFSMGYSTAWRSQAGFTTSGRLYSQDPFGACSPAVVLVMGFKDHPRLTQIARDRHQNASVLRLATVASWSPAGLGVPSVSLSTATPKLWGRPKPDVSAVSLRKSHGISTKRSPG